MNNLAIDENDDKLIDVILYAWASHYLSLNCRFKKVNELENSIKPFVYGKTAYEVAEKIIQALDIKIIQSMKPDRILCLAIYFRFGKKKDKILEVFNVRHSSFLRFLRKLKMLSKETIKEIVE